MPIKISSDQPFVGQLGEANKIAVVERDGDLICKSARWVVSATAVLSFAWGCFLTYIVWFAIKGPGPNAPRSAHIPWFVTFFVAVFGVASLLNFFRMLLGSPYFEVSGATGNLSFFKRRTREPWGTVAAAEISNFAIEKRFYTYKQHRTENAVLILFTTSGEQVVLCGSPDEAVIQSLGARLKQITEKKIEGSAGQ